MKDIVSNDETSSNSDDEVPLSKTKRTKIRKNVSKKAEKSPKPNKTVSSISSDNPDKAYGDDELLAKIKPKSNKQAEQKRRRKRETFIDKNVSFISSSDDDEPLSKTKTIETKKIKEDDKNENKQSTSIGMPLSETKSKKMKKSKLYCVVKKIKDRNNSVSSISSSDDTSSDEDIVKPKSEGKSKNTQNALVTSETSRQDEVGDRMEKVTNNSKDTCSSINSESDDERKPLKSFSDVQQKMTNKRKRSDSSDGEKPRTKQRKTKSTGASTKLSNLMRYIRVCGVRITNYAKIFEGCKSMKSKEEKLSTMLKDLGISGRPTLSHCQKIKLKREEEKEVAELDLENIITSGKRSTRSIYASSLPSVKKENNPPPSTKKYMFGDLSDLDSEGSDNNASCEQLQANVAMKKRIIMSESEDESENSRCRCSTEAY